MKFSIAIVLMAIITGLTACRRSITEPGSGTGNPPGWQLFTTLNSMLPDQQINTIAIKNNVKWIGTANGLVRIEDNDWKVYHTQNSALPSAFIQALAIAPDGTAWIGTNQGLVKFDGNIWTLYTPANSLLPDKGIMSIAHDDLFHRTWIGTADGLVLIDAQGQWTLFDETAGELPLSMTTDATGALWIGAHEHASFRGSIKKFDNGAWKSYQLAPMGYESAFPYGIAIDHQGTVIALLAGTVVRTVIRFDGSTWQEITRPDAAGGVRALALEADKIWVGGNGLCRFGSQQENIIAIPGTAATILVMAIDSDGNKWLGTAGGGLAVYQD